MPPGKPCDPLTLTRTALPAGSPPLMCWAYRLKVKGWAALDCAQAKKLALTAELSSRIGLGFTLTGVCVTSAHASGTATAVPSTSRAAASSRCRRSSMTPPPPDVVLEPRRVYPPAAAVRGAPLADRRIHSKP